MITSRDLLRSYRRLLHHLSGAEAVSIYLPGTPEVPGSALLIHGDGPSAVPELADPAAAGKLPSAGPEPVEGGEVSCLRIEASREPRGRLIRVSAGSPPPGSERRRKTDRRAASASATLWIGLRLAAGTEELDDAGGSRGGSWRKALELGGALAEHYRRINAVLIDPVTELPGRADFQATLRREVADALDRERPLALVLTNPDDFSVVNERFGSDAGDTVAREIALRLQATLRSSDLVHRYGGVVFAVILPETTRADAVAVAEKLHTAVTEEGYLDGAVRLGFSFGLATLEAAGDPGRQEDAAWELIRRADRALNKAKLSSSGRVVAWQQGSGDEVVVHRDRLNGIFTADLAKDYRNMLLLWDTVDMMSATADSGDLAASAVERLSATFKPDRTGLFRWPDPGQAGEEGPQLAAGHGGRGTGSRRAGALVLAGAERALVDRARAEGELVQGRVPPAEADGDADSAYAVPLLARGETLGCLYLAGRAERLALDASDLIFLKALAGQLAAALDRAELAERERRQKEQESRRLRSELEEVRGALEETRLVHGSPQMEALLDTIRRVAPTDAGVLVTGASGTGKELVARTVHALSPRRGKPPVVVDCAAISASLIDSELFGHERGAYTGAAGRAVGRLAEAAGSTLILDEIGELPLEVQAKLLRFVQEKQITPVGGTRPRSVDVRLVAVTNRDLQEEVAEGRFRQDLYYRLKVVHLEVPPLAERPEDVPLLIDHYVRRFSARYGKQVRGLSRETAALAARHSWPGNVRELENRILQAVILCEGDEIGPRDLDLDAAEPPADAATLELDLGQLEKRHIERVLESEGGSVARAARRLGIQRNTLYQKIKKYGLER